MESSDNENAGAVPYQEFRLSWLAYARALVVFFLGTSQKTENKVR